MAGVTQWAKENWHRVKNSIATSWAHNMKDDQRLTDKERHVIRTYNIIDLFTSWFLTKKQRAKLQKIIDETKELKKIAAARKKQ